jgi:predicted lipoprotein with Yx(FWY)xxD motif
MRSRGAVSTAARRYATGVAAMILVSALNGAAGVGMGVAHADDPPGTASPLPPAQPAPSPLPVSDGRPVVGTTWLKSADMGALGSILVNDTGRTVYTFSNDTPKTSTCFDTCADTWIPVLTFGDPTGGTGIDDSMVETIDRGSHSLQVSYFGHPLYYYAGDTTAGQVNGQNLGVFGGRWSVVDPKGRIVP